MLIDWPVEQRKVALRLLDAGLVSYKQCRKPWQWHGVDFPPFTFASVVVPAAGSSPERLFLAAEIP